MDFGSDSQSVHQSKESSQEVPPTPHEIPVAPNGNCIYTVAYQRLAHVLGRYAGVPLILGLPFKYNARSTVPAHKPQIYIHEAWTNSAILKGFKKRRVVWTKPELIQLAKGTDWPNHMVGRRDTKAKRSVGETNYLIGKLSHRHYPQVMITHQ